MSKIVVISVSYFYIYRNNKVNYNVYIVKLSFTQIKLKLQNVEQFLGTVLLHTSLHFKYFSAFYSIHAMKHLGVSSEHTFPAQ